MSNDKEISYNVGHIAKKIIQIMHEKKLTAYQLSLTSGVDRAALSRILKGNSGLTVTTLLKIFDGLEISPENFFKGFG